MEPVQPRMLIRMFVFMIGEKDHQAVEDCKSGLVGEVILCAGDEIAPGGRRLLDSKSEKTQAGFLNNGISQLQC